MTCWFLSPNYLYYSENIFFGRIYQVMRWSARNRKDLPGSEYGKSTCKKAQISVKLHRKNRSRKVLVWNLTYESRRILYPSP